MFYCHTMLEKFKPEQTLSTSYYLFKAFVKYFIFLQRFLQRVLQRFLQRFCKKIFEKYILVVVMARMKVRFVKYYY